MILFAGLADEPPLELAIACAERQGLPHAVLDQRHAAACSLELELEGERLAGILRIGPRSWPVAEISAIYARTFDPTAIAGGAGRAEADDAHGLALNQLLADWLELAPGRIVNRPSAMASNVSKPYQAGFIIAAGFRSPPTLVTNDPAELLAFHAQHGRIVYKSISSIRSIVREWQPAESSALARLPRLPTQFQALVPGQEVRVHVVGDTVIATAIRSAAIDYRYAGRTGQAVAMAPVELPAEVGERCRLLVERLGLAFAGLDLRCTPEGIWYCFEVNPSPAYSFFQEMGGQPISEALVRYLAAEEGDAWSR